MAELTGLRELSAGEAHLRQTVPAALSGRRVADAIMVARFGRVRQPALSWFRCESGAALAIDRTAGLDRRVIREDGLGAADLLQTAEPLLREIEEGLGIALEPVAIAADPPADSLVATVSTLREGAVVDRVLLALPRALELLPAQPRFAPELLGIVEVPAEIVIAGPRVEPHEAAELRGGDLVLLGPGPLAATFRLGDARAVAGRFDPARRCFRCD